MKFVMISNDIISVLNLRIDLLNSIKNQGNEVYILAPNIDSEKDATKTLRNKGFVVRQIFIDRVGMNPIHDLCTIFSIYKSLKLIKPDMVFSYTIKPVIYGSIAAYLSGVDKVFALICGLGNTFKDGEHTQPNLVGKILNRVYRFSLSKCKYVFFQNKDDLKVLTHFNILDKYEKGVVVNGSGIDLTKFNIEKLNKDYNGITKSIFIMVARLLKYKGVVEYVEAARILKSKYPNAEFHLVGDIDANPVSITKDQFEQWKSSDYIICWGKLGDVRPALSQANVFVLPSYYREGVPRSILEAMSMGKAIITTDNVGCKETVEIGKNGFLVEPRNINSLVDAMEKLILNPLLIDSMSEHSRYLAEEKFDVDKVNNAMICKMFSM